jgi:hypothetical protein
MSKPQSPCSKCKGVMTVKPLETFSGEEGGVKVTIQAGAQAFPLPHVRRAVNGHDDRRGDLQIRPGRRQKGLVHQTLPLPRLRPGTAWSAHRQAIAGGGGGVQERRPFQVHHRGPGLQMCRMRQGMHPLRRRDRETRHGCNRPCLPQCRRPPDVRFSSARKQGDFKYRSGVRPGLRRIDRYEPFIQQAFPILSYILPIPFLYRNSILHFLVLFALILCHYWRHTGIDTRLILNHRGVMDLTHEHCSLPSDIQWNGAGRRF